MRQAPIIVIHGPTGSGKDTVADLIIDLNNQARKLPLAGPIYSYAYYVAQEFAAENGYLWDLYSELVSWLGERKESILRPLLMGLGQLARDRFGEDYWLNMLRADIDNDSENIIVVVPDARYTNEVRWAIDTPGVYLWRLYGHNRRMNVAIPDHPSEQLVREKGVFVYIDNTGDLETLKQKVNIAYAYTMRMHNTTLEHLAMHQEKHPDYEVVEDTN